MTYNPNQPSSSSSPTSSVASIRTNYAIFASIFSNQVLGINYNHMPLNDVNQGKHAAVMMLNVGVPYPASLSGTVLGLKSVNTVGAGNHPQLFVKVPRFLPTTLDTTPQPQTSEMQLTYNVVNLAGPIFQSFLPGGYILYMATTTTTGSNITVTPTPTKIVMVQAVCQATRVSKIPFQCNVTVTQPDKFLITSDAPALSNFRYMVIAQQ